VETGTSGKGRKKAHQRKKKTEKSTFFFIPGQKRNSVESRRGKPGDGISKTTAELLFRRYSGKSG